jgi:hypothetical protein
MAVGIRHSDHVAPSIRKKLALTSLTSGFRSAGIVRLRTEAMEFCFYPSMLEEHCRPLKVHFFIRNFTERNILKIFGRNVSYLKA